MNVASHLDDLERWRQRAEECREVARQMNVETAKEVMLKTAGIYDGLAARVAIHIIKGADPPTLPFAEAGARKSG
jgi:hypothetical protein